MAVSKYVTKGKEAFETAKELLKKGDLKQAEAEFESAKGYLDAHQTIEKDLDVLSLGDEARGWVYFTKGSRSLEFARDAERLEEPKVATASYRKAYSQFFQALEGFTSLNMEIETNKTRG